MKWSVFLTVYRICLIEEVGAFSRFLMRGILDAGLRVCPFLFGGGQEVKMAEFPSFLDLCESSQPLPKPSSLPSDAIKLVRTGFPCEVADASAPSLAENQRKKRIWRNRTNIIRGLIWICPGVSWLFKGIWFFKLLLVISSLYLYIHTWWFLFDLYPLPSQDSHLAIIQPNQPGPRQTTFIWMNDKTFASSTWSAGGLGGLFQQQNSIIIKHQRFQKPLTGVITFNPRRELLQLSNKFIDSNISVKETFCIFDRCFVSLSFLQKWRRDTASCAPSKRLRSQLALGGVTMVSFNLSSSPHSDPREQPWDCQSLRNWAPLICLFLILLWKTHSYPICTWWRNQASLKITNQCTLIKSFISYLTELLKWYFGADVITCISQMKTRILVRLKSGRTWTEPMSLGSLTLE